MRGNELGAERVVLWVIVLFGGAMAGWALRGITDKEWQELEAGRAPVQEERLIDREIERVYRAGAWRGMIVIMKSLKDAKVLDPKVLFTTNAVREMLDAAWYAGEWGNKDG